MAPLTPRNSTQYGFTPLSGTDYSRGQEPAISRRLGQLARSLHLRLTGISGYRSPAHSVAVGGFPNDPHTRGQASDTGGAENIPESTLERFGLTRPFAGAAEANHIQLLRSKGGTSAPKRTRNVTLADEWVSNGGSRRLAPIMAAISMAESGGRLDAQSPPNDDGSIDYGPWQVNSVHGFDPHKLTTDWGYTTRAAISIEKSQGLNAWTTYKTGAYKTYMGNASTPINFPARTRPGGESASGGGNDADTIFASYLQDSQGADTQNASFTVPLFGIPIPVPDPVKLFTDPAHAISDAASFLKWIAWIFHPKNILRAVEFLTGLTIMGIGVQSMFEVWRGTPEKTVTARSGRAVKTGAKVAATAAVPEAAAAKVGAGKAAGAAVGARAARNKKAASGKRTTAPQPKRPKTPAPKRERKLAEDIPF